jgi:hypothetical protein
MSSSQKNCVTTDAFSSNFNAYTHDTLGIRKIYLDKSLMTITVFITFTTRIKLTQKNKMDKYVFSLST